MGDYIRKKMGKLVLQSETLTTPSAGTLEYDGGELYFTPLSAERGLIPNIQFYRLDSALVGANATGAQNTLGVGCTLSSSTVYYFELYFTNSKTAGTTSHTLSYGFGGTATVNNALVNTFRFGANATFPWVPTAAQTPGAQSNNTVASTVFTGPITSANYNDVVHMKGTVSINQGGTFIPQYTLSAAPGGAYTTQAGSYMLIYPIGAAGSATNIGTWA